MSTMADKMGELRTQVFSQSLDFEEKPGKAVHQFRYGYFGFPGPLCISDDSYAPVLQRKAKPAEGEEMPTHNIQTNPSKRGMHPKVFFSFQGRTTMTTDREGNETFHEHKEPFVDAFRREVKKPVKWVDPDNKFKPPGTSRVWIQNDEGVWKQTRNKLGYAYIDHKDGVKDPKAVREALKGVMPLRQIYTKPMRKGGGGVLTRGVLFGKPPEEGDEVEKGGQLFPSSIEGVPDDYDAAKKARKKEMDEHKSCLDKAHEGAKFKSMAYGNGNFQSNKESFGYGYVRDDEGKLGAHDAKMMPTHIPRDPIESLAAPVEHEGAFKPCNPMKRGVMHSAFGFPLHSSEQEDGIKIKVTKFPAWKEDPVHQAARRKKGDEEEETPGIVKHENPFKRNFASRNPKPTPSVVTLMRNMRSERPRSFSSPCL